MMIATLGAGCFWGVEHFIAPLAGVLRVRCGYMGGDLPNPTYEQVKQGNTGHAEVVEIVFDEQQISFMDLLDIFWQYHNPTTVNQQGVDVGSQYRSVIFYHSPIQQQQAQHSKNQQQQHGHWAPKTIVTEIVTASQFWEAEEYHQGYFSKHNLPSCHLPFY